MALEKPRYTEMGPIATSAHICQICGSTDIGDYVKSTDAHFVRCTECGLIFNDWTFSQDRVTSEYYDRQEYFQHYLKRRKHKIGSSRRVLGLLGDLRPSGVLVDVGCGVGAMLEAAQQLGYQPLGIDVGEYPVQFCQQMGYDARLGSLTDTGLPDECADIVTAFAVIEHIPVTAHGLAELRRILKPSGILAFTLPNGAYIKAHLLRSSHRSYGSLAARIHMVYHNPRTIRMALQQSGFEPLPLPWLVRKRFAAGIGSALQELLLCLPRGAFRSLRRSLCLNRMLFGIARKSRNAVESIRDTR